MRGYKDPLTLSGNADCCDAIPCGIKRLQHVRRGNATDIMFGGFSTKEHDDVNALWRCH
jgi:hypothetical protein